MRPHHSSIPARVSAAVYFEQEISAATEDRCVEAWLGMAEAGGALLDDSWFATTEGDRREFREFRHALPEGINEWLSRNGQRKIASDMAVPEAAFEDMMRIYHDTLAPTRLAWLAFGHLGDNHLHVNILPKDKDEAARAREVYGTLVEKIVALGGTLSAEHGLGKIKARYLAAMYGEEIFTDLLALKRAFDPGLILCRGNMIPENRLPIG
jgi:D-lactate dehydrogenase (cytochrome)